MYTTGSSSRPAGPILFHDPGQEDHAADDSYASLPAQPDQPVSWLETCRRPIKSTHLSMIVVIGTALLLTSSLIVLFMFDFQQSSTREEVSTNNNILSISSSEAAAAGSQNGAPASEKSYKHFSDAEMEAYLRGRDNVSWQRTAYHFHPAKNLVYDPNGPLFYKGWYHIFYQHDPYAAVWGNMSWGHAVSKDMVDWFHLPLAMVPEHWYEIEGVLSGSATVLPDGQVIMLYTGNSYDFTQVQCLAYAANASDPLLIEWVKYSGNPILFPPPGIGYADFRDPSTAWLGPDGKWLIAIGSKHNETGVILLYKTSNFTSYEMMDWELHGVVDTGMWECADLFPVSTVGTNGLDMPAYGPGIKHVLKESGALFDIDREDYYSIGTYDPIKITWTPDDPKRDVGLGWRYDYGKFYASKSFYDQNKMRRILWAFIGETDSRDTDLVKGWASVLNVPRTVVFDKKTGTNLLQWPIEELNKLRSSSSHDFEEVELLPGSLVPLDIGPATQLDISATFEVDEEVLEATVEADASFNCTGSNGSAARGVLGPFGLVIIADDSLSELTPIYFYIAKGADGSATTHFCADETRSSLNSDVRKMVVGSKVPVLNGEKLTMRLLVDHSVVESFAQGGRIAITSRVYPTKAIYEEAHLFLFNNATGISVKASLKIWHMAPAKIDPFPFPE